MEDMSKTSVPDLQEIIDRCESTMEIMETLLEID